MASLQKFGEGSQNMPHLSNTSAATPQCYQATEVTLAMPQGYYMNPGQSLCIPVQSISCTTFMNYGLQENKCFLLFFA